jgi:hypothetical protein
MILNRIQYLKNYYKKNKKKYLDRNKLQSTKINKHNWYIKNKKRLSIEHADYYIRNKNKICKKHKLYRKTNKNKRNKCEKIKRNTNIDYKILINLRSRIYIALKKNYKNTSTIKLLGCSLKQLRIHLEKQFTIGMNWNNYGKWHIDHIKPCASFDLSKPSEQRKCFHYTNLQPLWAKENLKKGARNE